VWKVLRYVAVEEVSARIMLAPVAFCSMANLELCVRGPRELKGRQLLCARESGAVLTDSISWQSGPCQTHSKQQPQSHPRHVDGGMDMANAHKQVLVHAMPHMRNDGYKCSDPSVRYLVLLCNALASV
jgi:hypothetical protein